MVRAAFKGDGRNFHQPQHRLVSWAWPKTTATTQVEIAINRRPTKLRFPQGSEVSITGCPKLVTNEKSGLIKPAKRAEIVLPDLRRGRGERGEICRRSIWQTLSADGMSRHLKFDCRHQSRRTKALADENRPD